MCQAQCTYYTNYYVVPLIHWAYVLLLKRQHSGCWHALPPSARSAKWQRNIIDVLPNMRKSCQNGDLRRAVPVWNFQATIFTYLASNATQELCIDQQKMLIDNG